MYHIESLKFMSLLAAILGSSLLTSIFTSWVSWYLQKNNYRQDYYKKILIERFQAFKDVDALLRHSTIAIHDNKNGLYYLFMDSKTDYYEFREKLQSVVSKSFWLSTTMSDKIQDFQLLFHNEVSQQIDIKGDVDEQIKTLGFKLYDEIQLRLEELKKTMYQDLSNLHNIQEFIKDQNPTRIVRLKNNPHR